MQNKEQIIDGVSCCVNTCKHYEPGDLCSAGKIEIKHSGAQTSEETDCATFQSFS